jgi:hypothetical protein
MGVWRYSSTSALDGGEWSASRPGRFTPWRGWVGPRAGLDTSRISVYATYVVSRKVWRYLRPSRCPEQSKGKCLAETQQLEHKPNQGWKEIAPGAGVKSERDNEGRGVPTPLRSHYQLVTNYTQRDCRIYRRDEYITVERLALKRHALFSLSQILVMCPAWAFQKSTYIFEVGVK